MYLLIVDGHEFLRLCLRRGYMKLVSDATPAKDEGVRATTPSFSLFLPSLDHVGLYSEKLQG